MAANNEDPDDLKKQIARLDERYSRLVQSIHEGVSVVSLDGIITYLNPAFESLTGWPPDKLIGSPVSCCIHPEDLPLVIEGLQRQRNGERLLPIRVRLLQSSGDYRPVEVVSEPEFEGGHVTDIWSLVTDLTTDEQLEKQQAEVTQEKQRLQSLVDLTRAAAARVRSPLTQINLSAYRLSKQVADPSAASIVEHIEYQVQHVARLIERLLTMAELDADRVRFSFTPVQMNRVVEYIHSSMSSLAEAKKITFTVHSAEDLPLVRADEPLLYRAIREVVENALEFTPESGSVTITTLRKDSYGVIEVQDTGIGITPDMLPHLFERFYHLHLPVPDKLGLGLPIARKIIDKHGGTIEVNSIPAKGTTARIAIPLYKP
jgi:PAS domain S-box-containing protein